MSTYTEYERREAVLGALGLRQTIRPDATPQELAALGEALDATAEASVRRDVEQALAAGLPEYILNGIEGAARAHGGGLAEVTEFCKSYTTRATLGLQESASPRDLAAAIVRQRWPSWLGETSVAVRQAANMDPAATIPPPEAMPSTVKCPNCGHEFTPPTALRQSDAGLSDIERHHAAAITDARERRGEVGPGVPLTDSELRRYGLGR